MEEIKFRGKRPNSGKWIYGYLYQEGIYSYILHPDYFKTPECSCEVVTETVGQYTGLKDKNGVEIYENSILKSDHESRIFIVEWIQSSWRMRHTGSDDFCRIYGQDVEVIGYIHDNPELI